MTLLFLIRRYLSLRDKPLYLKILILLSLVSTSLSVLALILVLAIMKGFEEDFRDRILKFRAPLILWSSSAENDGVIDSSFGEWLTAQDSQIVSVEPFIEGDVVLESSSGHTAGARLRGLSHKPSASRLGKVYGSEENAEESGFAPSSLMVGEELAILLQIHPDFEEVVRVMNPLGEVTPSGDLKPTQRSQKLLAVYRTGFYEFDSKFALVPYADALNLLGDEGRSGFEIFIRDATAATSVKESLILSLQKQFPKTKWNLQSAQDQNPKLFAAMKMERWGLIGLMVCVLMVASLTLFGLTSLTVIRKMSDMALLQSIGLPRRQVVVLFTMMGAIVGLIGDLLGGGFGLLLCVIMDHYPVQLPSTYYMNTLPISLDAFGFACILVGAPLVCALAALYPAIQAGKIRLVEGLSSL